MRKPFLFFVAFVLCSVLYPIASETWHSTCFSCRATWLWKLMTRRSTTRSSCRGAQSAGRCRAWLRPGFRCTLWLQKVSVKEEAACSWLAALRLAEQRCFSSGSTTVTVDKVSPVWLPTKGFAKTSILWYQLPLYLNPRVPEKDFHWEHGVNPHYLSVKNEVDAPPC